MRAPEPLTAPPMILLVEESQSLRPLVSLALLDAGYEVFAAPDPTEASAVLERFHLQPALAIVDLHASLQSGTEVAEALARGRAELPIIFVVRYLEDPDALLPGLVLEKPFSLRTLCRVIENVLARGEPLFSGLKDDLD